MSVMSAKVSLFRSTGHAPAPQWTRASVPAGFSTALLKPSQSGSLAGTGQGGRFWAGLGQRGQLSELSGLPSPSLSAGAGVGDGLTVGLGVGVGQGVPPMDTPSASLA